MILLKTEVDMKFWGIGAALDIEYGELTFIIGPLGFTLSWARRTNAHRIR